METAVSTVHHNHCASSVALKRLNLLTAAAQTLHLPHCVTDRVQLRSLAAHWKLRPLSFAYSLLKGLSWTVLNAPCSVEFKCSDCFQCPSCGSETLSHFINIISAVSQKMWWKVSALPNYDIKPQVWDIGQFGLWIRVSSNFFNSNRIPETRTARFNEYAFQKERWVNEHNQSRLVQVLLSSSKVEKPTRCSSFRLIRDWQGSE